MPKVAKPVVGVICCNRQVDGETAQLVMSRYVRPAMQHANCQAVLIPAIDDDFDAGTLIGRLDGLLLTGSPSNVETRHYGQEGGEGPFDAARDSVAFALINEAMEMGAPVFGICRGFQEINVALGGSLRRDVGHAELPHHAPDGVDFDTMFAHSHPVSLTPDGLFRKAFHADTITVNSSHFQGVDRLGKGLHVEATSADGLIEGFSCDVDGAPVVAVQWHPEWQTPKHADRLAYFGMLGRALRGARLDELAG